MHEYRQRRANTLSRGPSLKTLKQLNSAITHLKKLYSIVFAKEITSLVMKALNFT